MHDLVERTQTIDPFHEELVILRLGRENIMHAGGDDRLAHRLLRIKAVGDDDERELGMDFPKLPEEPLCRVRFAVLLLRPVCVSHAFRT